MYQENVVLCGASAYEQKYYFNKDFDSLPDLSLIHISEPTRQAEISYAVFCLKKKKKNKQKITKKKKKQKKERERYKREEDVQLKNRQTKEQC